LDSQKTYSGSQIQGSKRHRIPDPDPQTVHSSLLLLVLDLGSEIRDPGKTSRIRKSDGHAIVLTVIFVISCIALGCWIKSVKNQIWYALGSCNGNAEYLIEMILAIAEHVAGNHTFPGRAGLNGRKKPISSTPTR
jgi:hypothetical protein